jgi:hypothetical protein
MEERKGTYRFVVGKPEGKRRLEIPRRRWEDNIKMNLREVEWGNVLDRSVSEQGQMAGCYESGNEPSGSIKCGKFLE